MDSQPEFSAFEELPQSANPRRDFLTFRAGDKIIRIPVSVWKDGRMRADASEYGAGCPVSRKQDNLNDRVARALQPFFSQAVEAVSEVLEQERRRRGPARPRAHNKLATKADAGPASPEISTINPKKLIGTPGWEYGNLLRWLNNVEGMSLAEKSLYGWMVFRAGDDGVFRKSLRSLARDAGVTWQHVRENLIPSLLSRPLLYRKDQGDRVPSWFFFLEHPAMFAGQESCPAGQLSLSELGNSVLNSGQENCPHKEQEPVFKKHDHVHAPVGLTPEQKDLINQINELTESESRSEHFRSLWEMCVKEDQIAVFQAIGETRCMKREGKIKKTIGGALRWHYKNFHAVRMKTRKQ